MDTASDTLANSVHEPQTLFMASPLHPDSPYADRAAEKARMGALMRETLRMMCRAASGLVSPRHLECRSNDQSTKPGERKLSLSEAEVGQEGMRKHLRLG